MTAARHLEPLISIEEYYELEDKSEAKHEFQYGRIVAMAGADIQHVRIQTNFVSSLGNLLRGKPCEVFGSDLRLRLDRKERTFYPDATIICGQPQFEALRDGRPGKSVINPRVLVEVLSPSTADHDRGEKFDRYREIASFEEYVLIAQEEARIDTFRRLEDGTWRFETFVGLDATLKISCLPVTVPLKEIYFGVTFPPPKPIKKDRRDLDGDDD